MTFISKDYYQNNFLSLILFINTFIYTVLLSLIFFHSLILIKAIIIKCFVSILHRYGVFNYVFSAALSLYNWYINYPIPSLGASEAIVENLGESGDDKDKDKDQVSSGDRHLIIGIVVVICTIFALQSVDYLCPEAIPLMEKVAAAVGASIYAGVKGVFQSFDISVSGKEPSVDFATAKRLAGPEVHEAVFKAKVAYGLLKNMGFPIEYYHSTVRHLRDNNVPSDYFFKQGLLIKVITQIDKNMKEGEGKNLFSRDLSKTDLIFYEILNAIDPK